jgi:hypothetical protein
MLQTFVSGASSSKKEHQQQPVLSIQNIVVCPESSGASEGGFADLGL